MSQWAQKYPQEQRDAIARAMVDGVPGIKGRGPGGGVSANQAVELAAAGHLPDMPAFAFNVSTARYYAQQLRREREDVARRKARDTVDGVLDDLGHRLARLGDTYVTRLENRSRGKAIDPSEVSAAAKMVRDIRVAITRPGKTDTSAKAETPAKAPSLLERLAASGTEQSDPPPTPEAHTTTHTPNTRAQPGTSAAAHTQNNQNAEQTTTPVRSDAEESSDPLARARAVLVGGDPGV